MRTWNDSVAKKCTDVTLGRMTPPTRRMSTSKSPEHENRLPGKGKRNFAYLGEEAAWDGRWPLIIGVAPNAITRVLIRGTQEGQHQRSRCDNESRSQSDVSTSQGCRRLWKLEKARTWSPLEPPEGPALPTPGSQPHETHVRLLTSAEYETHVCSKPPSVW